MYLKKNRIFDTWDFDQYARKIDMNVKKRQCRFLKWYLLFLPPNKQEYEVLFFWSIPYLCKTPKRVHPIKRLRSPKTCIFRPNVFVKYQIDQTCLFYCYSPKCVQFKTPKPLKTISAIMSSLKWITFMGIQ